MTQTILPRTLDHVALLVENLDHSLQALKQLNLQPESVQTWLSEGTREAYIGEPDRSGRLLLMEAAADGPYRRALKKRGPGLHHIALRCPDHLACAHQLGRDHGWLLHHHTLDSLPSCNTIWLARPGLPLLIELMQGDATETEPLVSHLKLSILDFEQERLLSILPGIMDWQPSGGMQMTLANRSVDIIDLCHGELREY